MIPSRFAGIVVLITLTSALAGPPPATEVHRVTDNLHGTEIGDDYRWLEGDDQGATTPEVAAWTDAQNAYTRSVLDTLPGREALEARLRQLMQVGAVSSPAMHRNRYFYTKREGDQAQAIVYVRNGQDGPPRKLIDPVEISPDGLLTVAWITPDHAGKLMAFGTFRAGDENASLYLMDVDSGRWLADYIPGKVGGVSWLPDNSGFIYRNLQDITDPYSGQIKFHTVGTSYIEDVTLVSQSEPTDFFSNSNYTEERIAELRTTYGPQAWTSRDGRWLFIAYYTDTRSNDLWAVDLDRWMRTREPVPDLKIPIIVGARAQSWGATVGDTLYMLTTLDAPNGRVVAVDLNHPAQAHWREIIPHRTDAVITDLHHARGIIAADYLQNANSVIELFDLGGNALGQLRLPGIGTASLTTSDDRHEAFLSFASFNEPNSIYRVDLKTGERWLWERPDVPVDPSSVQVEQVWYSSKDGTKVSMFLVYPKSLERNGKNPTMLYGYGGFNVSQTPFFSATYFPWFEKGGVLAVANLRGGGEYGQAWHEAGMLEHKQNVFDDFIGAAEWLVDNGYTNPAQLGIAGGSNGGLLTGAVMVQRPDLFGAVVSAVPLLDMLRYHKFLMARYWVPEYGSADDPAQFPFLRAYSPYQNIAKGTRYPAALFTAGENDARVHPLHARKMVAALQAATTGDPAEHPIFLWVERDAGHGAGKPLDLRVRDVADFRIFMMWQLGMLD